MPKWKKDAFDQVKMSNYAKIFLKFEKPFWDDLEYFYIAGSVKGQYSIWKPLTDNIVVCIAIDEEAKRLETLSTDTIKDEVQ